MKKNTPRHTAQALLLGAMTAFTANTAAAEQPDDMRGPTGLQDYNTIAANIDSIAATRARINENEYARKAGQQAAPAGELEEKLEADRAAIAPQILLTPSLSERDAGRLIQRFAEKSGSSPGYLTKASPYTGALHECQTQMTPEGQKLKVSAASAHDISGCMESYTPPEMSKNTKVGILGGLGAVLTLAAAFGLLRRKSAQPQVPPALPAAPPAPLPEAPKPVPSALPDGRKPKIDL